jgi:hypothetical protein
MAAVPISMMVVMVVIIMMIIIITMRIFMRAIVSPMVAVFFDFTPGCCHQQTGQAE